MSYYIGDYPPNDFNGPRGWICPKCGKQLGQNKL